MYQADLEKKITECLTELNRLEQDELRVNSSIYISGYIKLKEEKVMNFRESLVKFIKFNGRNPENYLKELKEITDKYSSLISRVIKEFDLRYIAVNNELQDVQMNQKISTINTVLAIKDEDPIKMHASAQRKYNYEIVSQECVRQLKECEKEVIESINKIFPDKNKQLIKSNKISILDIFLSIFHGGKKIQTMFDATSQEIDSLKPMVEEEMKKVKTQTIDNLIIIKDARRQTQFFFNKMLGGRRIA